MIAKTPMIAIVWAPHEGRTEAFAESFKIPIYHIHYLQYKRPLVAPLKYIAQWIKTWQVLLQQRPRFVYITNPPPFAALCVFLFSRFSHLSYIMDTHPPTLYSRKWSWTVPLQRFLARAAFVNIIDQERFKRLFASWGARAIILERSSGVVSENLESTADGNHFDITIINTFAVDEPLDIILEAAKQLPDVRFFVLGNTSRADPALLKRAPQNVIFTGYLLGADFWSRLYSSRAVMALTTYPYSLLAGAQDGMALCKPLILSRQPALTEFFTKGAVFVENTTEGIVAGVQAVQTQERTLSREIAELKEERRQRWEANFGELLSLIRTTEAVQPLPETEAPGVGT